MKDKFKILIVCSSNICRSPYCEYLLRRMIQNDPNLKDRIEVSSSAVFNKSKRIFPKAVDALVREGFSKEEALAHVPTFKRGAREKFENADVIIGMSKMHRLLTPRKFRNKYVTLSEIATGKYVPIPDPFLAKNQEEYDKTMQTLKDYTVAYFKKLKNETHR